LSSHVLLRPSFSGSLPNIAQHIPIPESLTAGVATASSTAMAAGSVPSRAVSLHPELMRDIKVKPASVYVYIPSQRQQADLFLAFVPTIILGGAVGGGLLAGPVVPVIVGGGAAIAWLIKFGSRIKHQQALKEKEKTEKDKGGGGGGGDDDDPDDEDKKNKDKNDKTKYPHGIYENNPKHNLNSKGHIAKPPLDGQKALDNSLKVPGTRFRVAIENKKIIMLKEHRPCEWHGYIEENFHDLPYQAKNALWDARLITNPKSGKVK